MDFEKLLEKYKFQIGMGLIGLVLVGVGAFSIRQLANPPIGGENIVEILSTDEIAAEEGTIFIDIEGAIENPGVYELPADSRVNDLLIRAGGLSAEADREWVTKNINLAQRLADGLKIYIPGKSDSSLGGQIVGGSTSVVAGAATDKININTASIGQLDALWGIGEKRAEAIIANRPYQTLEELKTKASIPKNVYEQIKDKIALY